MARMVTLAHIAYDAVLDRAYGRKVHRAVRRPCDPALRVGAEGALRPRPAWGVRAALGRGATRDSGRLLPEIAPKIAHSNLTRVLQRPGVADDQARAGIDLELRNRLLLDFETAGIHHVLAVHPVYRGRNL